MDLSTSSKEMRGRSRNVTPENSRDYEIQNISRASSSVSSEKSGVNVKLLEPMPLYTKDKLHAQKSAKKATQVSKIQPPPVTIEIPQSKA
jgi:hypothetical protein